MKIFKIAFIALFFVIVYTGGALAQKNFLKDADKAFNTRNYFTAIELYKKAYLNAKKPAEKAREIFQTAECYRLINDTKSAEQWYEKAIKVNYPDPKAVLYLADLKKTNGKYDEAMVQYNKYKQLVPDDPRGENGAKSCELAAKWKDNPSRYKVENVAQINSKQRDFSPSYADKKHTKLYFASTREGTTGGAIDGGLGENFADIFETQLDKNGKWSTPTPLPDPVNTPANEGGSVVSRKGNMMVFTRCPVEKGKVMPCVLYITMKKGQVWDTPEEIPFCMDTTGYNGHPPTFGQPALSADEQTLIFTSDMKGGYGDKDLWMSTYNADKKEWSAPVNLGPTINTPGYDGFPFLREDGTLYFASNGQIGMGGLDIFKAKSIGDHKWGEVTNLQAPINSQADDFGIIFEGKKDRGYFASNREGGKGSDDIWQFYMPPLLYTIEGVVTDCINKETIEGVTMKLVGSDGSTSESKTDKSGYFKFDANGEKRYVNENTSYVLSTAVDNNVKTTEAPLGFLASSVKAKETTVGVGESKIFKHDFCLTPIAPKEKGNRFPDVLYEYNSAALTEQAKDSLNFLYQTLVDNPTFVIELSSHTDSRGNAKYNQTLSEARAKSCVDYLISKGINKDRMIAKGYGKERLLITDAQIAKMKTKEEQEAAHQKNRRTVFSVLRRDFVDPNAPKIDPAAAPAPKKEGEEDEQQ